MVARRAAAAAASVCVALLAVGAPTRVAAAGESCHLATVAAQPNPSLTQCYAFNTDACCVSAHDEVIKASYHSLWSESCLREFPILELFFCFGCSPTQEAYTNHTGKRVKLCESIADQLLPETTWYDRCGLALGDDVVFLPGKSWDDTVGNVADAESKHPAELLINYQYTDGNGATSYPLRPPFFSDYYFEVVDDDDSCHSSAASALQVVGSAVLAVAAAAVASAWGQH